MAEDNRRKLGLRPAPAPAAPAPRPMANLPQSARVVTQYPDGVPTGAGRGNAGGSAQPGQTPPDRTRIRDRVDTTDRRQAAFNATAAAGMQGVTAAPGVGPAPEPAQSYWQQNAAAEKAAREAGEAANRARLEQKMGYLSRGMGLPDTSDHTKDAYWARADMAAWANANQEAAAKLGWQKDRDYNQGSAPGIGLGKPVPFDMSGENPVADPSASYRMGPLPGAPEPMQGAARFDMSGENPVKNPSAAYTMAPVLRDDGTPGPEIPGETVFQPSTPKGQALEILEGTFKPAIKEAQVEMAQQAAAPAAVNDGIQLLPFRDGDEAGQYGNAPNLRRFF